MTGMTSNESEQRLWQTLGAIQEGVSQLKVSQAAVFSRLNALAEHGCAKGEAHDARLTRLESAIGSGTLPMTMAGGKLPSVLGAITGAVTGGIVLAAQWIWKQVAGDN